MCDRQQTLKPRARDSHNIVFNIIKTHATYTVMELERGVTYELLNT